MFLQRVNIIATTFLGQAAADAPIPMLQTKLRDGSPATNMFLEAMSNQPTGGSAAAFDVGANSACAPSGALHDVLTR